MNDGTWRIKTNMELDNLIQHRNIINYVKCKRMSWFGHIHRKPETSVLEQVGCSVFMLHCAAVYRCVYMEQVGCSVVMLHCAAVYRCVYMEQVGCCVLMLHCAAVYQCLHGASRLFCCCNVQLYIGVFIWSK